MKTSAANYKPGKDEGEKRGAEKRSMVKDWWMEVGLRDENLGFVARTQDWEARNEAIFWKWVAIVQMVKLKNRGDL